MKKEAFVDGKFLKYGVTTGACAQAATRACAYMLSQREILAHMEIELPDGTKEIFEIEDPILEGQKASCQVKKYAGDDPDVTDGVYVRVCVSLKEEGGICFRAGEGVGIVSKEGLLVPVGQAAINPVPRAFMAKELVAELGEEVHGEITVSIPGGDLIAKKTFNPRIGIEGGLSILGTSGRVKPMSADALKETILLEVRQKSQKKPPYLCVVLGNYGENLAKTLAIPEELLVMCSNFIGYAIDAIYAHGVKKIYFIGHIGKLAKVSAGIFDTHSKVADARCEVMAAKLLSYGHVPLAKAALSLNTLEEMAQKILAEGEPEFFFFLAKEIQERIEMRAFHEIKAEVLLFGFKAGILSYVGDDMNRLLAEKKRKPEEKGGLA